MGTTRLASTMAAIQAPLTYLRAIEREYALEWEAVDERHEEKYEGPRQDGVVLLQKLLP